MTSNSGNPRLGWLVIWAVLLAIPLVPFSVMTALGHDPFEALAGKVEGKWAAVLVCFSLLASDVVLPIPSSFVAVVSGQALGALAGGMVNWIAITLGHFIGFALARRWGRGLAERLIGKKSLTEAGRTWTRGATLGLIFSRPVPVLAEAMSMFAGLSPISATRFFFVTALANLPHSFAYSFAGAQVRDLASLNILIAACVGVPTVAYLAFALVSRGGDEVGAEEAMDE